MGEGKAFGRCESAEARQFDFWVGEWDLRWGEDGRGKNVITKEYGGCVIQEKFDGRPGMDFQGMSISVYDAQAGVWRQTWADDNGSYLDLTGGMEAGEMMLTCEKEIDGRPARLRMVFHDIREDELSWRWERSFDGGMTWEVRWAIHYRRIG